MDDFEIKINLPSNCNLLYCVIFHADVYLSSYDNRFTNELL